MNARARERKVIGTWSDNTTSRLSLMITTWEVGKSLSAKEMLTKYIFNAQRIDVSLKRFPSLWPRKLLSFNYEFIRANSEDEIKIPSLAHLYKLLDYTGYLRIRSTNFRWL